MQAVFIMDDDGVLDMGIVRSIRQHKNNLIRPACDMYSAFRVRSGSYCSTRYLVRYV